jgi:hypothetical protein
VVEGVAVHLEKPVPTKHPLPTGRNSV